MVHTYSYDQKNRLTNLAVNNSAGPIASYAYTVDPAGHRTQVTELGGRTVQYGYDSVYRLTSETISGAVSQNGAIGYVYDSVGNRTSMTSTVPAIGAGTFFYDANDRRGTDVYDADGNTVSSGGLNYVYDFENHLVQQGGATFVYDGDGNRVQKIVAGNVTHYFVDSVNPSGFPQVLAEETSTNFAFTSYTWGLELISRVDFSSGVPIYFVHDGHGSVRALTNPSGGVTDTYDYDAFGNLLRKTGTTANNYLFVDEQFDPNLNLYYNRARYLSTNTGRFWSMDTDEGDDNNPLSLHKYLYAQANPADNSDPSGNQIDDIGAIAVGMTLDAMPAISLNVVRAVLQILPYNVVVVTPPKGTTYEPESKVKNGAQAAVAGVAVGKPIRIAVPPGIFPQTMVDEWSSRSSLNPRTWSDFKKTWSDPANDYKVRYGPIFDAYGNFEFGATGAAAGFSLLTLHIAADVVHKGWNDPINQADITSGFDAIKKGGKLSTKVDNLVP